MSPGDDGSVGGWEGKGQNHPEVKTTALIIHDETAHPGQRQGAYWKVCQVGVWGPG